MTHKEHASALRGSGDQDIGHSDNEIETDGLDGLEDAKIGNVMPQRGRYVLHDGHSGIVLAFGRLLSVDTIMLDWKMKMKNNAIDGDIGYFGNKIDTTGLDDSEETNVSNIKPQVGCFLLLVSPGAIVIF